MRKRERETERERYSAVAKHKRKRFTSSCDGAHVFTIIELDFRHFQDHSQIKGISKAKNGLKVWPKAR